MPTFRPRRRTVMRVAVSKTSWRLWEMITTARPCSARRRTSASTCSVCATPRAAVGSSRITSFEFHCTAFATATDCRCPPESEATGWRIELMVVTASDLSVSAVFCSMIGSFSRWNASCSSRPRYMFWTTSRLSQSARSWYTTSIPSFPASFGPWMCTSWPSNRISPLSGVCVPATHFTSVDFPAPLSPTSAITSPLRTSKSTSVRACTDPNDFVMFRRWRRGVSATVGSFPTTETAEAPRKGRLRRVQLNGLLAVLLVLADAHLALRQEMVREEAGVVRLRDPHNRKRQRRLALRAVLPRGVRLRRLALEERNRGRGRSVRLVGHVLVHGARLPAGEDVLDALRRRVLAAQRDRLQVAGLQVGDHGAGDVVVRRDGAVDLVVRLDEHLGEDRAGVRREPVGHELLRALGELAALEERVQDCVVTALEPERVLVRLAAPELGDDRLRLALERGEDAVRLRRPDGLAVERDVDGRGPAGDLTVVVDRLEALRGEELLDRCGRAVVERGLDDHLGARGEARLRLRLLLLRVVQRVRDHGRHACGLERLGEIGSVELHPADGRLRVRQQDANLDARLLRADARAGPRRHKRCNGGQSQKQENRPAGNLLHCGSPSVTWFDLHIERAGIWTARRISTDNAPALEAIRQGWKCNSR